MSEADTERPIERVGPGARTADRDRLAVEAPLELRASGEPVIVLMRTPGHDEDLARGLLYGEGAIDRAADLAAMHRPPPVHPREAGNVLELGVEAAAITARMAPRTMYASSACGVCGTTSIASLEQRAEPLRIDPVLDPAVLASLPERLRQGQHGFHRTGGLHAAAAFTHAGELLAVREDVGRHNAVDKLVGWALAEDALPLSDAVMCVSSRLSYEIVHKAVVAGVPVVVAVSAPSSLAVDLAERFRVTLCGFTRDGGFNIYSHGHRVG